MRNTFPAIGLMLALLAGCAGPGVEPAPPEDFGAAVRLAAPRAGEGGCWNPAQRPAIFETVSEQVIVTPTLRDATGAVVQPAITRSETRQSVVRPRQAIWFAVPCPPEYTPAFIASLQRALKARGIFAADVTGVLDPATRAAIRRFQAPRGLDSDVLSLAAARALGLSPGDFQRS